MHIEILSDKQQELLSFVSQFKRSFYLVGGTYPVTHPVKLDTIISMPSLLSLAAMKAFALGRRTKWKDYVDLYFLLRDSFTVQEISDEAEKIFGDLFSEKLFRQQLAFHADIDYREQVDFLPGFEVGAEEVKDFLIDKSLELNLGVA
ncbi:MAG: nucleotidyl transferase AbiEii/AbiGii toxin family protein [Candidatus Symbiothrix sp.]|jgi:hypothetical protein|nr:nucleotidyl transferase AbiEii/AbiGii toxin family protein [Candidatus Symbiothrix sp.]